MTKSKIFSVTAIALTAVAAGCAGLTRGGGSVDAANALSVRVASDVRIWPQPLEVPRSQDYEVSVDGSEVDVIGTTAEQMYLPEGAARPYSFASFSADGEVTVDVTIKSTNVVMRDSAAVVPAKLGARFERLDANRARITLKAPCTAVFEPDGRHRALVLNVCAPERNPPKPDDPKVKYFGPGFHHLDQITLTDGETLYLAPGAWVESTVKAKGRDIAVRGPGVLSGACWAWQQGPTNAAGKVIQGCLTSLSGENITVRDVTLYSSFGWTLVFNGVTNAVVDNVKILCGRVINDDGIDICRAKDVVIRDSFVRAQDDCLAVKWWCENLFATNCAFWVDFANAVRIGYECEKPPLPMRNINISDLDVIHLSLAKQPPTEYWGHSVFCVQASNGQTFEDIAIDNVRIPAVEEGDNFLVARTMQINPEFKYHGGFSFDEPGYIRGLSFRDVTVEGATRPPVFLEEFDTAHFIKDFVFDRVTGCGDMTHSRRFDQDLAVFLSDLHLNGIQRAPDRLERYQEANLRQTVNEILAMDPLPANVVVFGDLVLCWGDVEDYRLAKECLQPLVDAGIKLTFGLGNHDRRDSFLKVFPECGDSPVPGRFVSVVSMGKVDLIMLDSLKGEAAVGTPGPTEGALDKVQADWLEKVLPTWKRPFFLCAHHPTWELKVNGKSMESVVMECDNAVGFIHGHRHHWSKEAFYRGYPLTDTKRRLGLPSTGYWGDIGYVIFRAGTGSATAELVQRDYWYPSPESPKNPAWAPMIEENQNQRCTFVYAGILTNVVEANCVAARACGWQAHRYEGRRIPIGDVK